MLVRGALEQEAHPHRVSDFFFCDRVRFSPDAMAKGPVRAVQSPPNRVNGDNSEALRDGTVDEVFLGQRLPA